MPEGPITGVPGEQSGVSRRNFIKGVIAAGATVSASAYLFRANIAGQDSALPGSVERLITLNVNGQDRRVDQRTEIDRLERVISGRGHVSRQVDDLGDEQRQRFELGAHVGHQRLGVGVVEPAALRRA